MLRKLALLAIVLCSTHYLSVSAQSSNAVSVYFSPEISYRFLRNAGGGGVQDFIIDARNDYEKPMFGFSAGGRYQRQLLSWLSIGAGVEYQYAGYFSDALPGVNTWSLHHNINLPVTARFHYFNSAKFSVYALAGALFKFNVARVVRMANSSGSTTTDDPAPNSGVSNNIFRMELQIGNGISYQINDRFSVFGELFFGADVIESTSGAPISENLFRAGAQLGFSTTW